MIRHCPPLPNIALRLRAVALAVAPGSSIQGILPVGRRCIFLAPTRRFSALTAIRSLLAVGIAHYSQFMPLGVVLW